MLSLAVLLYEFRTASGKYAWPGNEAMGVGGEGIVSRSQTIAGRESLVNCPYKTCSNTDPNWGGR